MGQLSSLLNTYQLAAWLGISTRTLCLWAECSELPAIKVGRQWRFERDAIQQWLATGRTLAKTSKKGKLPPLRQQRQQPHTDFRVLPYKRN